jgi:hypothetical protein
MTETERVIPGNHAARPAPARGLLSRTWELELLISGAVVFGLLKLPGAIDAAFVRADDNMSGALFLIGFVIYFYLKAMVYVLIASLLLHLTARAYWVGLVGLESVFPRGVQWDAARFGPLTKDVYREKLRTLPQLIDAVDDFCSVIFAFVFLVVIGILYTILIGSLCAVVAYGIDSLLFSGQQFEALLTIILVTLAAGPLLLAAVDRRYGGRADMHPGSRARLRALMWLFARLQLMPLYGTLILTLFTNAPRRVIYPIVYVVSIGTTIFLFSELLLRRDVLTAGSAALVPDEPGRTGVDYRYYESRGQSQAQPFTASLPTIQSDVITDPYIRLFLPYYARRDNDVFPRVCPGVQPVREGGISFGLEGTRAVSPERSAAALRCLVALRRVTLDGQPQPDLEFRFYRDPRTGHDGIVTYIPVAGLSRGAHLLTVNRPARSRDAGTSASAPHYVWFWI